MQTQIQPRLPQSELQAMSSPEVSQLLAAETNDQAAAKELATTIAAIDFTSIPCEDEGTLKTSTNTILY